MLIGQRRIFCKGETTGEDEKSQAKCVSDDRNTGVRVFVRYNTTEMLSHVAG